ncbi:MAG: HTTM domain-containing protein [Isosphaeraceae bacterium]|nr:HTTM domain-containing protein [Isosphaeraceae bacterium]
MNPIRDWNTFWFKPVSARPLGAIRILYGLIALANLGLISVDFDYWYTGIGLQQGPDAREVAGPLRYSLLQYHQDPATGHAVLAATAVVAALFTLGWHTRVMSVLLYLGTLTLYHRNIVTNCGPDSLMTIMSFYLMLAPCGAAYSLDALRAKKRRGGTLAEPLITPWAQRLIQCQLCLIYFNTAVWKCTGVTWPNGTALHYVLHNPEVGRLSLDPLSEYPLAISLLTHGALLTEFLLAFFLWFRATRPWVIFLGVVLHGGIEFIVNAPLFSPLMITCYIAFLHVEEWDGLLRRVNPFRWFARSEPPQVPGRVDGPSPLRGPHARLRTPAGEAVVDEEAELVAS